MRSFGLVPLLFLCLAVRILCSIATSVDKSMGSSLHVCSRCASPATGSSLSFYTASRPIRYAHNAQRSASSATSRRLDRAPLQCLDGTPHRLSKTHKHSYATSNGFTGQKTFLRDHARQGTRTPPGQSRSRPSDFAIELGYSASPIRQQLDTWRTEALAAGPVEHLSDKVQPFLESGRIRYDHKDDGDDLNDEQADAGQPLGHYHLTRGDLVQLFYVEAGRRPILAYFIRNVADKASHLFYTSEGRFQYSGDAHVVACAPAHASPALIDTLLSLLPERLVAADPSVQDITVPRDISAPIVSKMLNMQVECDRLYRENTTRLDGVHALVADQHDLTRSSIHKIAATVFRVDESLLTAPQIFTTCMAIRNAGFAFSYHARDLRLGGPSTIRSMDEHNGFRKVCESIRQAQEYIARDGKAKEMLRDHHKFTSFINKMKQRISASRHERDFTIHGTIGPKRSRKSSSHKHEIEPLTTYDRMAIRFIFLWCCKSALNSPELRSLPPFVLKATGMYHKQTLDPQTAFVFLQEIGAISPNAVAALFREKLPDWSKMPFSDIDYPVSDSMRDLRHDWGDMPVFCIDAPTAHEIDDGISISEPDQDGTCWVHVHVANPTSSLSMESRIAAWAKEMPQSLYLPHMFIGMLPKQWVRRNFSLAPNRPCLTVSAKLSSDGEVLNYKIRPGLVRNVRSMTYDQVDEIVDPGRVKTDSMIRYNTLRVGEPIKAECGKAGVLPTDEEVSQLKRLYALSAKRRDLERTAMADSPGQQRRSYPRPTVRAESPTSETDLQMSFSDTYTSNDDASIELRSASLAEFLEKGHDGVSGNDVLVAQMMKLANEIAAKWCIERSIPIVFRGTQRIPDDILQTRADEGHPRVGFPQPTHSAVSSARPIRHDISGLDAYTRVTSPLRRYSDMIGHWQIEAALRKEAELGRSLAGCDAAEMASALPVSYQELQKLVVMTESREKSLQLAQRSAERQWASQLIVRAHFYREAAFPNPLKAIVWNDTSSHRHDAAHHHTHEVMLLDYGLPAQMRCEKGRWAEIESTGAPAFMVGDIVEVSIAEVDAYRGKLSVEPIRVLSRLGEQKEASSKSAGINA